MTNSYVLITSAYNEEKYIEKTINCVLKQTIRPKRWYIISDCSTDNTDDIIQNKADEYDFITYLRRNDSDKENHDFASKVHALNTVLNEIDSNSFNYIGILDADIILPDDYYKSLISIFKENENHGLIGGSIYETIDDKVVLHDVSLNTVSGAVQFYRMDCFRELGKFYPLQYGGEDSMMGVKANFNGWKVQTFPEIKTYEQKFVGRSKRNLAEARFFRGKVFYDMGYHPFFMIIKCIFRTFDKPYIIGSFAEFWGYLHSYMIKQQRIVPMELIKHLRKQQLSRLIHFKAYR